MLSSLENERSNYTREKVEQEDAAVKENTKKVNKLVEEVKNDSDVSTAEEDVIKVPLQKETIPEKRLEKGPAKKPERQATVKATQKPDKAPEKTTESQAESVESKDLQPQSTANWWEKGEVGPKATKLIEAMDMAHLGINNDTVSDVSVEEPVLFGLSEAVAENVIKLKEGSLMVGRSTACDYVIDSEHISDKHAQIVYEAPTLKVIGMPNTTNGTFVNGDKVGGSVYLQSGDILSFGPIEFKVMLPGANQTKEKRKAVNQQAVSEKSTNRLMPVMGAIIVVVLAITVWFIFK